MFANDLHLGTSRNGHGLLVGFSTAFPEMETAINLSPTTMEAPHLLVRFGCSAGERDADFGADDDFAAAVGADDDDDDDDDDGDGGGWIHNNAWVCLSRHLPGRLGGWPAPLVPGT